MSDPEPWPDGPRMSEDSLVDPGVVPAERLHQPWRASIAAAEVLFALLLVFSAWWAWRSATVSIELPAQEGVTGVVTRMVGSWVMAAVGTVTLAGLLLLDAFRQLMLALRTRRRRGHAQPVSG
jgi:hypothetical protein